METKSPDNDAVLRPLPPGCSAALYVHVPFCSVKCFYCDFLSFPLKDEAAAEMVLRQELAQLDFFLRTNEASSIPTLYVGGGTPSVLPRHLLGHFLKNLRKKTGPALQEFSLEANPESLDTDFLFLAEDSGATRISLGIQTFDDAGLALLGRRASASINRKALELTAARWKGDLSLDLIYGYPGQTAETAEKDLLEALAVKPGHISLYALTVEEETPLALEIGKGAVDRTDDDAQETIRDRLDGILESSGYVNYEISNYALPGKECLHNGFYWELRPYFGLGPGGVSTLPAEGPAAALRLKGKPSINDYLSADYNASGLRESGGFEIELLSPADMMKDFLLMGLRTSNGIDENRFEKHFSLALWPLIEETRKKYSDDFFRNRNSIGLTPKSRRFLNRILSDSFLELDRKVRNAACFWP